LLRSRGLRDELLGAELCFIGNLELGGRLGLVGLRSAFGAKPRFVISRRPGLFGASNSRRFRRNLVQPP
jgi:hypothetical protein